MMDEQDFMDKVVQQYEREGYRVIANPKSEELPTGFEDAGIDLIAERGSEKVAIQVKRRDELYDLDSIRKMEGRLPHPADWRFDLVVFPPTGGVELPRDGAELGVGYIASLQEEGKQALSAGLLRSSLLLAWSATEAAMREAARRAGESIDRDVPRFVLKTLYSNGVISRTDYERVDQSLHLRNAVVHGFAPAKLEVKDVEYLLEFSARLLQQEPAQESA